MAKKKRNRAFLSVMGFAIATVALLIMSNGVREILEDVAWGGWAQIIIGLVVLIITGVFGWRKFS